MIASLRLVILIGALLSIYFSLVLAKELETDDVTTIMLIGRTGVGKSCVGNALMGSFKFGEAPPGKVDVSVL